jgi:Zn-dependent peptidase ImmA (M78 family)
MRIEAELAAREVRGRFGTGTVGALADSLQAIESTGGIPVVVARLGEDGIAGAYLIRRRQPFILLNGSGSLVRARFTLAHEYGHHCLGHGQVIDARIGLDSQRREEIEANHFAAELLMPREGVDWWFREHGDQPDRLEAVVRIAHHFGVSTEVARYRLQAVGWLSGRRAFRDLRERIASGEHLEIARRLLLFPRLESLSEARRRRLRLPARTEQILLRAVQSGLLSADAAAERMERSRDDVVEMAREIAQPV